MSASSHDKKDSLRTSSHDADMHAPAPLLSAGATEPASAAVEADQARQRALLARLSPDERRAAEKALVRRIDMRLMPLLMAAYITNYLDRNGITTARLGGMQSDLNLNNQQWATSISILFVGYILLQVPSSNLMLWLGRPRLYMGLAIIVWGGISAATAAADTYGHLLVIRIFLGVVEAAFFPGALLILSKWYKKSELSTRTALLYSASILSSAIAGLISAGILSGMDGVGGLAGWKWIFILEGVATVVIGALCLIFLPEFPHNSSFLSETETALAVQRIVEESGRRDIAGEDGETPMSGFIAAMKDPAVHLLTLTLTSVVVSVSFNAFFPSIVGTLGYSRNVTLLLTCPIWVFAWLVVLFNAMHADKTGERFLHVAIPLLVGIVGFIIASVTTNLGARFFALFIMASSYGGFVVILPWISNSVPEAYKRASAISWVNCVSQLGNIAGGYVWNSKWGPSYWRSNTICACSALVGIASALALRQLLQRRNHALAQLQGLERSTADASTGEGDADAEKLKLAQANFRYLV